jgi:MFS family permease
MLTGVCLGAVIPVSRSLVSNYYELKERGFYFGLIELASGLGGFAGCGLAVFISTQTNLWTDTWKVTYLSIGSICILCGLLCFFTIPDPYYITQDLKKDFPHFEQEERLLPTIDEFKSIIKKKTFILQVCGGITGAQPWSALQFLILFFQRMGMGQIHPVLIFASVGGAAALGGVGGGWLGDKATSKDSSLGHVFGRLYARTWISHLSIYSGIILSALLVKVIPYNKDEWYKFAIMGFIMGLSISLVPANNSAIQSDLFPQNLHSCSFAVQFFFEGFFSSLSPLLVGVLNDYMFNGKELAPKGGNEEWEGFSEEKKKHLLEGLANSIIIICSVFWFLCALTEYPIYYYYPRESRELLKEENDRREKTSSIQSLESRTGKI